MMDNRIEIKMVLEKERKNGEEKLRIGIEILGEVKLIEEKEGLVLGKELNKKSKGKINMKERMKGGKERKKKIVRS